MYKRNLTSPNFRKALTLAPPIAARAGLKTCATTSTRARIAYQDFLAGWKDADPDLPVLVAAKQEYAGLPQQ